MGSKSCNRDIDGFSREHLAPMTDAPLSGAFTVCELTGLI